MKAITIKTPKDLKDRFMYQVKWNSVQFLIDAEMFDDKTPARPGQDLYKNSRINSTKTLTNETDYFI